jgi:hypothetical protein
MRRSLAVPAPGINELTRRGAAAAPGVNAAADFQSQTSGQSAVRRRAPPARDQPRAGDGSAGAAGGRAFDRAGTAVYDAVFEILSDLQRKDGKTIVIVEQNAKKGLEYADIGYVLVSGTLALAGRAKDLLVNPDVGRLFLGG